MNRQIETNPITIGKHSTWSSRRGKYFWIGFCVLRMVGLPIFLWLSFTHQEFSDAIGHVIGFEVFVSFLLVVFGILPKVNGHNE